jgi:hypothetical protein
VKRSFSHPEEGLNLVCVKKQRVEKNIWDQEKRMDVDVKREVVEKIKFIQEQFHNLNVSVNFVA